MPVAIILAVGAVLVVALLVWGPIKKKMALEDLKASCAALRGRLAVLRTQGGSVDEQARLQVQLDDCQQALRDAGIDVSVLGELLRQIETTRAQMRQEHSHFKSTDYADIMKRGNIRGTILRLGDSLAPLYQAGVAAAAEDPSSELANLGLLLASAKVDLADSVARAKCYRTEAPGCGRYLGSTEDDGRSKARNESTRVSAGLRAAMGEINMRIRELAEPAAREEREILSAETGGAVAVPGAAVEWGSGR